MDRGNMKIHILPVLQDNYMYLIVDEATQEAAIVDPVDTKLVTDTVKQTNVKLTKS
ncbi:Hydroxyacylglutathione hydrolase [Harpegnathos saltator]|uniref:Hydroxyacylglutathione hydrolase n=1 Tax=Harpegnathos saltator TaxID=610380 RepID=E2BJ01_HARSA|nr:Hydroxyacylglutathione hydrolase [Harpegnathos saltator]